ncbi:MAG TPA: substrate binding domain-containing protein, partial [Polyangiaceae bacterium]|nr:substrate binding domain-containing protein [Polyangiaceae bacterium]
NLTDAGQSFFTRMQTVIAEADEATRAVSGFASDPRGVVRITAPPGLGGRELPRIVARIVQRYPGLVLELMLTNRLVDLVGEGIDLAIRGGQLVDSSLVARKVSRSEIGVFAAASYLERRGRPRRPADLPRHDCLSYGGRGGKLPWRLQGPDGEKTMTVSGPIVCDDMGFLRAACVEGLGVAMLPLEVAAVSDGGEPALVRVMPRYSFSGGGMYVMWPSQKLVPARVAAVREALIAELSALFADPR